MIPIFFVIIFFVGACISGDLTYTRLLGSWLHVLNLNQDLLHDLHSWLWQLPIRTWHGNGLDLAFYTGISTSQALQTAANMQEEPCLSYENTALWHAG
jgi:hypothetical protein